MLWTTELLQEFDPREMDRLTALYDSIKDNATAAIKDSMAAFRVLVDSGTDLGDTVKNFVDTLNELPDKVINMVLQFLVCLLLLLKDVGEEREERQLE